jgi:transcriptional regulator with XRE-family HTH domain
MIRRNYSQKEVASDSSMPLSTLNGYANGAQEVPVQKAAEINKAKGDDLFGSQMSYRYFGTIKALDGKVSEMLTPTELDFLQEQETEEREERRKQAKKLIIKSKLEPLTEDDRGDLEEYVMQFLDEIVVELSIVFSILKILGMTITEAFAKRMPHWIKKKYMKG